jgi:hypothetical protein
MPPRNKTTGAKGRNQISVQVSGFRVWGLMNSDT